MGDLMCGIREDQEVKPATVSEVAAFARTWLEDWGMDLLATCDAYRDAAVSGIMAGRRISPDFARASAWHFKERGDAVYDCGELLARAISERFAGSGSRLADAHSKSYPHPEPVKEG